MPARDTLHDAVKSALVRDGWTITDDPYRMKVGLRNVYVDLGAERLIAAERGTERIAVEIKGFRSPSEIHDLEEAVGQFVIYARVIERFEPTRTLYLAVPESKWQTLFQETLGEILLKTQTIRLVVVDPEKEAVTRWIP